MKAFIYIGMHKCGSTSLQSFFSENYKLLRDNSAIYPYADSTCADFAQKNAGIKTNVLLNRAKKLGINLADFRAPHNALTLRLINNEQVRQNRSNSIGTSHQIITAINKQIQDTKPDKLILVSEIMSHFGFRDNDPIETLLSSFNAQENNVYGLIRRPDEYLQSWYGQELKFIGPRKIFRGIRKRYQNVYKNTCHFNYTKMIDPWVKSRNTTNISITNYSLIDDTIEWFVAKAKLEITEEQKRKKLRRNKSVHKCYYNLLRFVRNNYNNYARESINNLINFSALDFLPDNKTIDILGAKLRSEIYTDFRKHHEYLSTLTGKVFFDDYDEIIENSYTFSGDIEQEILCQLRSVLASHNDDTMKNLIEAYFHRKDWKY